MFPPEYLTNTLIWVDVEGFELLGLHNLGYWAQAGSVHIATVIKPET